MCPLSLSLFLSPSSLRPLSALFGTHCRVAVEHALRRYESYKLKLTISRQLLVVWPRSPTPTPERSLQVRLATCTFVGPRGCARVSHAHAFRSARRVIYSALVRLVTPRRRLGPGSFRPHHPEFHRLSFPLPTFSAILSNHAIKTVLVVVVDGNRVSKLTPRITCRCRTFLRSGKRQKSPETRRDPSSPRARIVSGVRYRASREFYGARERKKMPAKKLILPGIRLSAFLPAFFDL